MPPSGCGNTITTAQTWHWAASPPNSGWPWPFDLSTSDSSANWGHYHPSSTPMPKSVQLTHPTGASLAISESLSTFLLNRPTRDSPFFLGDWLASIDDAALEKLRKLAHAHRNGDNSPRTDDLLSTALIAQAA